MRTYLRTTGWGLATLVLLAFVIHSCKKDNSASSGVGADQQKVNIYLSDDPAGYFDNVFLDIKSVQVLVDTCGNDRQDQDWGSDYNRCHWGEDKNDRTDSCKVWDTLGITAGLYDVLALRNGSDTLLSHGVVPSGKIRRILITLGDNSYVVKDSVKYPLKAANGQLRLVVSIRPDEWEEIESGNYSLHLDFDIDRSIFQSGNGAFILRPVIHVFVETETGSISGIVTPHAAYPVITVYNDSDTAYALPWFNGQYKIKGLKAGSYSLYVNASNGYQDTTLTGITITTNKNTTVDAIKLSK